MTLIRRAGSLVALALLLGCASDNILLPAEGLRFAFSRYECGPADGPAMGIYLTRDPVADGEPAPPYVRIYIDLSAGKIDGGKHDVGPHSSDATAGFVRAQGDYDLAREGSVTANWTNSGLDVVGTADIVFNNAGHFVTTFDAPLGPVAFICA